MAPLERGGLDIKDPTLMNLALGENIIWCLVSRGK